MRFAHFAVLLAAPFMLAAGIPEPDGYRMDNYNAPVPASLSGARTVDAEALSAAISEGAVVIDVMPAPRRPPALPAGRPWLPVPRMEIPGSFWWPEVGRGEISPALDAWFRNRLASVTGSNRDKALAFYCKPNCWMSWNAAKRAIHYGYRHVLWFAGGAEAWSAAGFALKPGQPELVPMDP